MPLANRCNLQAKARLWRTLSLRTFCTAQKVGYTDQIEQLMKQIDSDIGDMSINDKVIRIRNLKLNLQKIKTRSFDVEHINKDERLLRLINSTCEDFRELSTANKIFLLNALSFYEIRNERF